MSLWATPYLGELTLLMAIGAIIMMVVGGFTPIDYNIGIKSINDDSLTSGSFFLGTGSISEDPVFITYTKNTDGSYSLDTFPASRSKIFEDSDYDNAYVHVYGCAFDMLYDIHVPKNTIKIQYTLDSNI